MQTIADVFFKPIEQPTLTIPHDTAEVRSAADFPEYSSEWWIAKLHHEMRERNVRLARLRSYYEGTNDTWRFANDAHRETFGQRFKDLRANYARTVVRTPAQRMAVVAIVLEGDDPGSDEAWRIWQANRLDARSLTAHLNVLSVGECPVIVGPNPNDPGTPIITVEDPLQVIVASDPLVPERTLAALKLWESDDGDRTAVLYLPDRIEWWVAAPPKPGQPITWVPLPEKVQQNPWGIVPVVTLENAPSRMAEHEDILGQLDMCAKTLYDMVTASDYLAAPQRHASGVSLGEEARELDDAGNPIGADAPTFQSGPNRVWTSEDPDAKFGQLPGSDLMAFIRQLESHRADIATITDTPHRMMVPPPTSVPPSGESVRLSDHPLTAKVGWKLTSIGDGWEQVIRVAFMVAGDRGRAARMDLEVLWKDPELRTEVEHVDALSKLAAMGIPQEELWRRAGATPQQIRRWKAMQQQTQGAGSGITADQANVYGTLVRSGVTPTDAPTPPVDPAPASGGSPS